MPWIQVTINATHEAVDWVRTLLSVTDYISDMEITEYSGVTSADPVVQTPPSNWAVTIRLYLSDDRHAPARIEDIEKRLSSLSRTGLTDIPEAIVVEEKPTPARSVRLRHRIGKRFVVLPAGADYLPESTDEIPLKLSKTLAFGSGLHPATRLSLHLLEQYLVPGMNTLDLGSGSGILSVAMAKLGATVLALDNDTIAVQATQETVNQNQVEQQVTVRHGSLGGGSNLGHWMSLDTLDTVPSIQPAAAFDLIAANLLARIHIAIAPDYRRSLRHTAASTGILITAGFTTDYADEVTAAMMDAGFEPVKREQFDEWVALAYQLRV